MLHIVLGDDLKRYRIISTGQNGKVIRIGYNAKLGKVPGLAVIDNNELIEFLPYSELALRPCLLIPSA